MSNEVILRKQYGFEAAHFLPNVPPGHKCGRMHGHSFRFEVVLKGRVREHEGWLIDFGDISAVVKPLIEKHLDHYLLNDIEGLENPTSELLAVWLWQQLKESLPDLHCIVVKETCTTATEYYG